MAYAKQTITRTYKKTRRRVKKSSGGKTKGKQRRCPTCGKYM